MPRTRVGAWLSRPMTSFHLIVAITALLITMGLTMVLSASGVYSYDTDGSPWSVFAKQLLWTVIGLFALVVAVAVLGGGVDGHEMEHARELNGQ